MNDDLKKVAKRAMIRRKKRFGTLRKLRTKKQKLNDFYAAIAEFDFEERPVEYGELIVHSPSATVIRKIIADQKARANQSSR